MVIRRMMSDSEKKLFEESIIKKYKLKHEGIEKRIFSNEFLLKIKELSKWIKNIL